MDFFGEMNTKEDLTQHPNVVRFDKEVLFGEKESTGGQTQHPDHVYYDKNIFGGEMNDTPRSSEYSTFAHFAETKFQLRTTHVYSCSALQGPLLPKKDNGDALASLASWVTILRVMGDLPENSEHLFSIIGDEPDVISKVQAGYKRRYRRRDIEDAQRKYSEFFRDPVSADVTDIPFLHDGTDTMLEKIQYLCTLAIYRTDLRDELYCQLCKQLTNNPSRNSRVRGWVLMEMFAGCFTPSEKFAPCFRSFLKEGPTGFSQKVERLTHRMSLAGTRGFPPSWLEFQATKASKPILLPIFMNDQRILIETDAATTVRELSNNLAETLNVRDNDGFSIYICLDQKISRLSHGLHRIMDVVSECEQYTKQMGMHESSSLWRLYYRKEYFTPWHNAKEDPAATNIIYQQVVRGMSQGEYQCRKEDVFVLLAAQRYYLKYRNTIDQEKLELLCLNWCPDESEKEQDSSDFIQKVAKAIQTNFGSTRQSREAIKADIVTFAMNEWSLMFSRYYDASRVYGPGIKSFDILVGVSGKGISVIDKGDSISIHLPFHEVAMVTNHGHFVAITTVKDDEYQVESSHTDDFSMLLSSFLEGLRSRSKYAIVTQDKTTEGLNVVKGDLIKLNKPFQEYWNPNVLHGVVERTAESVDIPRSLVYIPHIVEEPSTEILGMFTVQLRKERQVLTFVEEEKSHTLQKYSRYHFSFNNSTTPEIFNMTSLIRGTPKRGTVWQFSKDPIEKPLLRKSLESEGARDMALKTFTEQFMGDVVLKENDMDIELANRWIVEPASRSRCLADEIFCQVVKQLTNNPNKTSEERGWLLLLMLTTTAIPGEGLAEEIQRFVRGSKHSLAKLCGERLGRSKKYGCRLWPPHASEHYLMSINQHSVRVKVFIPSNTWKSIEVTSTTRILDIMRDVCTKLRLNKCEEYSLLMKLHGKLRSLSPREYYYDSLSHAEMYWVSQNTRMSGPVTPVLIMLKKIWVNIRPGKDRVADISFHFPQELPNFLRGYHHCSVETTARLAALVYRTKYGGGKRPLTENFSDICSGIAPAVALQTKTPGYWAKKIVRYYAETNGQTSEEAKVEFLQVLSKVYTFGSVFFEVTQRSKEFPRNLIVAINMKGVLLLDATTKKLLKTYDYSNIRNWTYDDDSVTLIVRGGTTSNKLLLETSVGHNMDDILMSYTSWVMNMNMQREHSFAWSEGGESAC